MGKTGGGMGLEERGGEGLEGGGMGGCGGLDERVGVLKYLDVKFAVGKLISISFSNLSFVETRPTPTELSIILSRDGVVSSNQIQKTHPFLRKAY